MNTKNKTDVVLVERTEKISKLRSKLPIIYEEHTIMEIIAENDIIIVVGETGCGKTTQVPQFLYEAGYSNKNLTNFKSGMIGVTQPRRIAAIHMAERVGIELNLPNQVGFQIRYEGNVSENTHIKFMTDGVLIKEIQSDFILSKYSAIILDEAHERSLHTDILIGLLSRIVKIRRKRNNPLKLFIMSATLSIQEFTKNAKLFAKPPPVIEVKTTQYEVKVKYCRDTPTCYIKASYNRIIKIHSKNRPGDILVFVATRADIRELLEMFDTKISENRDKNISSLVILPLHALLPKEQQNKVFRKYAKGVRKCIVATNVAETSLTIPGIRYVIDSGKVKQKVFDPISGAESFVTSWCSKASANQRKGRAGRVCNGYCYRLYSTAVFQYDFDDFSRPEILSQPLDNVILELKVHVSLQQCMNIIQIENFPFPTPPNASDIQYAEKTLLSIGALETFTSNSAAQTRVTEFGRNISKIPLSPRYAALVYNSIKYNCVDHMVAITSSLSVRELFSDLIFDKKENKFVNNTPKIINSLFTAKGIQKKLGDIGVMLNAIGASIKAEDTAEFCKNNGIRACAIEEVKKMSNHIITQIKRHFEVDIKDISKLTKLDDETAETIRKLFTVGFKDRVASKLTKKSTENKKNIALYHCPLIQQPLRIHPASSCFSRCSQYIIFNELVEGKYLYVKGICEVDPDWVSSPT